MGVVYLLLLACVLALCVAQDLGEKFHSKRHKKRLSKDNASLRRAMQRAMKSSRAPEDYYHNPEHFPLDDLVDIIITIDRDDVQEKSTIWYKRPGGPGKATFEYEKIDYEVAWLEQWKDVIATLHCIIVCGKKVKLKNLKLAIPSWLQSYEIYQQGDITKVWGDKAYLAGRNGLSLRNFGYWVSDRTIVYSIDKNTAPVINDASLIRHTPSGPDHTPAPIVGGGNAEDIFTRSKKQHLEHHVLVRMHLANLFTPADPLEISSKPYYDHYYDSASTDNIANKQKYSYYRTQENKESNNDINKKGNHVATMLTGMSVGMVHEVQRFDDLLPDKKRTRKRKRRLTEAEGQAKLHYKMPEPVDFGLRVQAPGEDEYVWTSGIKTVGNPYNQDVIVVDDSMNGKHKTKEGTSTTKRDIHSNSISNSDSDIKDGALSIDEDVVVDSLSSITSVPHGSLFSLDAINFAFNRKMIGAMTMFFPTIPADIMTKIEKSGASAEILHFYNKEGGRYSSVISGWLIKYVCDLVEVGIKVGKPYNYMNNGTAISSTYQLKDAAFVNAVNDKMNNNGASDREMMLITNRLSPLITLLNSTAMQFGDLKGNVHKACPGNFFAPEYGELNRAIECAYLQLANEITFRFGGGDATNARSKQLLETVPELQWFANCMRDWLFVWHKRNTFVPVWHPVASYGSKGPWSLRTENRFIWGSNVPRKEGGADSTSSGKDNRVPHVIDSDAANENGLTVGELVKVKLAPGHPWTLYDDSQSGTAAGARLLEPIPKGKGTDWSKVVRPEHGRRLSDGSNSDNDFKGWIQGPGIGKYYDDDGYLYGNNGGKWNSTCAVITVVRDEADLLPLWIRYYSRHIPLHDMYVLDHLTTDNSTHPSKLPKGINYKVLYGNTFAMPVVFRSWTINKYQDRLLRWGYKCVIFSDTDEIIVPNPHKYGSGGLKEYLDKFLRDSKRQYARVWSLEVGHLSYGNGSAVSQEPPFDWQDPYILRQRSVFVPDKAYEKPLLSKVPLRYRAGFHKLFTRDRIDVDYDLVMLHMRSFDWEFCVIREEAKYNFSKLMKPSELASGMADHWRHFDKNSKSGELCKYAKASFFGEQNDKTIYYDNTGRVKMEKFDSLWQYVPI